MIICVWSYILHLSSLSQPLKPANTFSFSSTVLDSSRDSAGHLFIVTLIYVLPKVIRCLIFSFCHSIIN